MVEGEEGGGEAAHRLRAGGAVEEEVDLPSQPFVGEGKGDGAVEEGHALRGGSGQ